MSDGDMWNEGAPERILWFFQSLAGVQSSTGIGQAVAMIFGWDWPESMDLVHRAIADAIEAGRATRALIDAAPPEAHMARILKNFTEVDTAVAWLSNIGTPDGYTVQQITNKIQATGWKDLDLAPLVLSPYVPGARSLSEDTVADLLTETRNLIDVVLAADDLPAVQKRTIIARLRDVETALMTYRISGVRAVEGARDALLGSIVVAGPEAWRDPKPVWKAVHSLVLGLGTALNIAASSLAIEAHYSPPAVPQEHVIVEIQNRMLVSPGDAAFSAPDTAAGQPPDHRPPN